MTLQNVTKRIKINTAFKEVVLHEQDFLCGG